MMYNGSVLTLQPLGAHEGLVEMLIDHASSSVNKIDQRFRTELAEILGLLESAPEIRGLLVRSGKSAFIAGADVFEFPPLFSKGEEALEEWLEDTHTLFNRLAELPFPTLTAINGFALGGGFELALATDARVMGASASVGLPEVTLGLFPGWGGTVRLSRLIGSVAAVEMILSGAKHRAQSALKRGLVDQWVDDPQLLQVAGELLAQLAQNESEWRAKRGRTRTLLAPADPAVSESVSEFKAHFQRYLKANASVAEAVIALVLAHGRLSQDTALKREREAFANLARQPAARNLVGLFISEQTLRQRTKSLQTQAHDVKQSAVIGAGIMGGGIAYQSARHAVPVVMKDIRQDALDLGLSTARGILATQIDKGQVTQEQADECLGRITPTLEDAALANVDLVVEAVVENESVKASVLQTIEQRVSPATILTSNTSTLSITRLAENLAMPERFCGMHFFNPVHQMPLVEVIRGRQSSDRAIATTVRYALTLGKLPIVVNDCPGFLVNRVLFPYFNAFNRLLNEGVNFERIDRVMETFGWPMGPALLADVIGMDTMAHADHVLQQGYPARMRQTGPTIFDRLVDAGALGQKSGAGFYEYSVDAGGRRIKTPSSVAHELLSQTNADGAIEDQQILDRMMIPMCLETALCLDEAIVASAQEADLGLVFGLGFPRSRGGALRYIDDMGLDTFVAKVQSYAHLGGPYQVSESLLTRAAEGRTFYAE